ncbi:MAG: prolipoprotein diacylglyceryl transferase [Candidatus Doudnabacteria bacterium]|nr:prolipoprotein diacylglyceryl transferase [Candidatus Doudnabacteria bacterium]
MARTSAKSSSAKTSGAILNFSLSQPFGQTFKIGFLNIRYYSLTFVGAIIAAYLVARNRVLKAGIAEKTFEDIVFWTILIGFLSARIYYVLFYFDQYRNNLSEIYKIWHGGLAIYGGLIGGALTLYMMCRKYKLDFFKLSDLVMLGIPIAQAIGRLGNYFNNEAFGKPTNLPWKIFIPLNQRPIGYENYAYYQPTFLYEIIANLIIFVLLFFIERKNKLVPGVLTALYIIFYSIARFAIEGIRLDSAYFGPFKGDQVTAVLLILLSLGLMVYLKRFRYNRV